MSQLSYRPDIDGLRALAVVPVVLYHLGGTPLTGGYIGVDIFFVISGYLITSIIVKGLNTGTFSLLEFYQRRIQRIFPALFVVLAVSLVAAAFILFGPDFEYFGEALAATAGFGSNFLFWQKSGYFEADSLTVPLLHTWSLAVEEQFYIFFPVALIVIQKFFKRYTAAFIILIALASFGLSAFAAKMGMSAILFYLLPLRAWELLTGSILSLSLVPTPSRKNIANLCGMAGFALIAYALFFFNDDTVFPGPNALFPVLGAVLVLYSGFNRDGFSARILNHKIPVFIGRISYSLYLWHWPLIVFFKYAVPVQDGAVLSAGFFVVSLILAYLSWRFIEQPVRHQTRFSRKQVYAAAVSITLLFVAAGLIIAKQQGFPDRFSKDIQELYNVTTGSSELPSMAGPDNSYNLVVGDEKARTSFLVWGDSHANAIVPGLDMLAKKMHKKGYLMGTHSCMPSYIDVPRAIEDCNSVNNHIVQFLKQHPEIKTVILASYWSSYAIKGKKDYRLKRIDTPALFQDGLDALLAGLEKDHRKAVFMIEIPPAPVENPALQLAHAAHYGLDVNSKNFQFDLKIHHKRQEGVNEALAAMKQKHAFKIVDLAPIFCPDEVCSISRDGKSLYKDDNHISTYGSEVFREMYIPLLKD